MSTGTMQSRRSQMNSCINRINGRINWCQYQQQLKTVTPEEREGLWAEEAGLLDALFGRDRTAFMKAGHPSQLTRYLCGLQDGQALLRFPDSQFPVG
jgi:hypothetical protein